MSITTNALAITPVVETLSSCLPCAVVPSTSAETHAPVYNSGKLAELVVVVVVVA